jgi:hypothetical protein
MEACLDLIKKKREQSRPTTCTTAAVGSHECGGWNSLHSSTVSSSEEHGPRVATDFIRIGRNQILGKEKGEGWQTENDVWWASAGEKNSVRACLGISGMNENEGYWGGGISTINQNFSKSPSILFYPLKSSIS